MEELKRQVLKMVALVSCEERKRNREVLQIIARIERILLWANDSINAETKCRKLHGGNLNGK